MHTKDFLMFRRTFLSLIGSLFIILNITSCTQETQNKISRSFQNWTGTNGVLDIYAGEKLVMRFIEIDKLTTATATDSDRNRPYRFGYGKVDSNFNFKIDDDEKNSKVYFEFSDYSTNYIFYENYNK
jgi:hypothetical protein